MKIGIFDPYLDDIGGGEKYMLSIAEYLSQKHQVDVFWNEDQDLKKAKERFNLKPNGVKTVPNIFNSKTSLIQKLIKSRKYDLIIYLSDGSIPLVASKKLLLHFQQPLHKIQVSSILDKFKLKRVNGFFCNSNFTKNFIEKRFNLKLQTLYPAVEINARKLEKENIILHVGRFRVNKQNGEDFKKQSVMIQAFKDMVKSGLSGWKLVLAVAVDDKDRKEFDAMEKLAGDYPVEFLINASHETIWETYSKAKIYWHASGLGEDLNSNPELAEHFGISTVEAMGAGVVPVVINAGGQIEIVEDGVDGFLWDTTDQLKVKTLKLIRDESLLRDLSKNAKESAKRFNQENFNNAIEKLIRQ